jgi:hypothetical protein
MRLGWRFWRVLAIAVLWVSAGAAGQPEASIGFRFCSPPLPPACVLRDESYSDQQQTDACQQEVARFEKGAFAYRACLQREIERAVLETNTAIDRFKCGIASKHECKDKQIRTEKIR